MGTGAQVGRWGQLLAHIDLPYEPTVPAMIAFLRSNWGSNELIVSSGGRLTYGEADQASALVAQQLLSLGIGKGTRVGLLAVNNPDWVVGWLATCRIGAIAVPLNLFARPQELRVVIAHADVQWILHGDEPGGPVERALAEVIPELVPRANESSGPGRLLADGFPHLIGVASMAASSRSSAATVPEAFLRSAENSVTPADPMVMIYTSGTTGEPKGVVHAQGALLRHAADQAFLLHIDENDRIFTTMPFFWIGGFSYVLLSTLTVGGCVVTQARFDAADALELIATEQVSYLLCWPPALVALRSLPGFEAARLRHVRRGLETLEGPRHGSLGMTETGASHSYSYEWDRPIPSSLEGSCGPAVPGVERRIVDPTTGQPLTDGSSGELWVRGPNLMLGYYRRERATTFEVDGWLRTSDRAHIREGCLFYEGRIDGMIKTSGFNVAPREVELALAQLESVDEAVVVGIPDPVKGQMVAALVVSSAVGGIAPDSVAVGLKNRLSAYKVPGLTVVVPPGEMPLLPNGKPDRKAIAEWLSDRARGGLGRHETVE